MNRKTIGFYICVKFLSSYSTELLTFVLISCSWSVTLARKIKKNTGQSVHLCLLPVFNENVCNIAALSMVDPFYQLAESSTASLVRGVPFTADYTRLLSRGLNCFLYIFLENSEIVLTAWDLPALISQLTQQRLTLSNICSRPPFTHIEPWLA